MSNKKDDRATVKAARINYWGRIIAAVIALIGVFGIYLLQTQVPIPPTPIEGSNPVQDELKINDHKDDRISKGESNQLQSEIIKERELKKIVKTILYKGKPISNAYFLIRNCHECKSTKSGVDGKVTISVPVDFIISDKEYEFDVFIGDSLLYSRAMRFSNLNLNKY